MSEEPPHEPSYLALLDRLEATHPGVVGHLRSAHVNRQERLRRYAAGARLAGIEELLDHLAAVQQAFRTHAAVREAAFLIERARGAFVTALEATLAGYYGVAFDAMRTIMEIEFLWRDFHLHPGHLQEWIALPEQDRRKKYDPRVLRERFARHEGVNPSDLQESTDYRAHSAVLHVTPAESPYGGVPGISEPTVPWGDDANFWEMFEHAWRLLIQLDQARVALAPDLAPLPPVGALTQFCSAYEQTRQMQFIHIQLLRVYADDKDAGAA